MLLTLKCSCTLRAVAYPQYTLPVVYSPVPSPVSFRPRHHYTTASQNFLCQAHAIVPNNSLKHIQHSAQCSDEACSIQTYIQFVFWWISRWMNSEYKIGSWEGGNWLNKCNGTLVSSSNYRVSCLCTCPTFPTQSTETHSHLDILLTMKPSTF